MPEAHCADWQAAAALKRTMLHAILHLYTCWPHRCTVHFVHTDDACAPTEYNIINGAGTIKVHINSELLEVVQTVARGCSAQNVIEAVMDAHSATCTLWAVGMHMLASCNSEHKLW